MIINTREDLDAVKGTPEYNRFMSALRGTLFELQRDDDLKEWVLIENNDAIESFGFTRADFEPIELPPVPAYEPDNSETLQKIAELKSKLASTDYVTLSDYDKDKPEILADRQAWRDEIRQLEATLNDD